MRGRNPRIDFSRRHRDTERKEAKIETEVVDNTVVNALAPGLLLDGPILSLCLRASVSTIYIASRSTEQKDARVRGRDPRIDFSRRHRVTERNETEIETVVVDNPAEMPSPRDYFLRTHSFSVSPCLREHHLRRKRPTEQEDARVRGRDPRIDFSRRHRDTERKETEVETEVVDNTVVNALAPGLLLTDPFFLCVSVPP